MEMESARIEQIHITRRNESVVNERYAVETQASETAVEIHVIDVAFILRHILHISVLGFAADRDKVYIAARARFEDVYRLLQLRFFDTVYKRGLVGFESRGSASVNAVKRL